MVLKYLPVIDSRYASWKAQVDRQMELGSNFLFVLPQNSLNPVSHIFGKPHLQAGLDFVDLLPLGHYLHPGAMQYLKQALSEGVVVHFVNQLQFPPRTEWNVDGYILYCGVRGIISRYDNVPEARAGCLKEYQQLLSRGEFPEISVYQWVEHAGAGQWLRVYAPSAEAWSTSDLKAVPSSLAAVA